jgi:hypothetical protein
MKIYGVNIAEGSTVTNLVVASGPTFPELASEGELFYRNDGANEGMYVYDGEEWVQLGTTSGTPAGSLISEIAGDLTGTVEIGTTSTLFLTPVGTSGTFVTVTTDETGRIISGTSSQAWSSITSTPTTLSGYGITDAQAADADLTAIAGLAGTSGLLKKTAADTWSLDTSTYLTGNQTVTVSGDATGSGSTSIALTLANSGAAAGTYTKVTIDAKGRVTTATTLSAGDIPSLASTYVLKAGDTLTGTLTGTNFHAAAGTVSAPSLSFSADTNTGIYRPSEDTLAFVEGGTEVMRMTSSSYVGIGTTAPVAKFQVDLGAEGEYMRVGGDNAQGGRALRFSSTQSGVSPGALHTINAASGEGQIALATASVERMRIDSVGRVAIGTSTYTSRFAVYGGDINLMANSTYVRSATTAGTSVRMLGINASDTAYVGPIDNGPTATFFSVAPTSLVSTFYAAGSERMRIDSAGNVGIGTTSPSAKLQVAGQVSATSFFAATTFSVHATNGAYYLPNAWTTSSGALILKNGTDFGKGNEFHWGYFPSPNDGSEAWLMMYGSSTATLHMAITDGNLVVGTTAHGGNRLTVVGTATTTALRIGSGSAASPSLSFLDDFATGIHKPTTAALGFSTNGGERMRLSSSGNLALGTTLTETFLTEFSASAQGVTVVGAVPVIALVDNEDLANHRSWIGNSIGNMYISNKNALGTMLFSNAGAERMRITSAGNVGIGTSTVNAKLDVNGDALINGVTVGLGTNAGDGNIALGTSALAANTVGTDNTAIGRRSLSANLGGYRNSAVGSYALEDNTDGYGNSALGYQALLQNITGNSNTAIGEQTLLQNTSSSNNTAVGAYALRENTVGTANVAVGANALNSNTGGSYLVAIGVDALRSNSTGANNVAQGYQALYANTTGTANIAIGNQALFANTAGISNSALGYQALYSNNVGSNNTAVGRNSMLYNTSGSLSVAIGANSLFSNTSGNNNSAVGVNSLYSNTTGGNNSAFGYQAMQNNTTGTFNSAVGSTALFSNTAGANNIAHGYAALFSNTVGTTNIAIGNSALYSNVNGVDNVAVGQSALYSSTSSSYNTAIGRDSLLLNGTGTFNTAVGYQSLRLNTTGTNSVAIGAYSLASNKSGYANTAVGANAMQANTTGTNNVAVGHLSMYLNTEGSNNTAMGRSALYGNTAGYENSALGHASLLSNTVGYHNAAIGARSLTTNTSGYRLTSLGTDALNKNTSGHSSVAAGYSSLFNNTTGAENVSIGRAALFANTSGSWNVAIGHNALYNSSGTNNFSIGFTSGADALLNITTASNQGVIGNNSTTNITAKVAITVPSDIRDKTEIAPVTLGLDFVTSVNPISYRFKKSRDSEEAVGRTILGFSAQELLPLQGNATIIDDSDQNLLKFNSQDLIAVLFKAVKEQQTIIDNLSARLNTLEGKK